MENQGHATATENEILVFKCSDGGLPSCDWTVSGDNEDLLIFQIEIHAQNSHNLVIDAGGKEKIRRAIIRQGTNQAGQ
jgi:predicted small metal-binding protein